MYWNKPCVLEQTANRFAYFIPPPGKIVTGRKAKLNPYSSLGNLRPLDLCVSDTGRQRVSVKIHMHRKKWGEGRRWTVLRWKSWAAWGEAPVFETSSNLRCSKTDVFWTIKQYHARGSAVVLNIIQWSTTASHQWRYSAQQHDLEWDTAFIQQFNKLHLVESNKQTQIMICLLI